jgi:hypothetical protein
MAKSKHRDSDGYDVTGYASDGSDAPHYDYAYSRDRPRRISGQCDERKPFLCDEK